jgi:hypothetical protein
VPPVRRIPAGTASCARNRRGIAPSPAASRALRAGTADLVVGIIGRGHLEYGHGTPYQLADLGVTDVAVLLPNEEETLAIDPDRRLADAVFRLDVPEARAGRRTRARLVAG